MSDKLQEWMESPQPEKGEVWRHKRTGMMVEVYRADASGVSVIRPNGYMTLYDPLGFLEQFELEVEADEFALRAPGGGERG